MYKYKSDISGIIGEGIKCPPDNLYEMEGDIYRFVHKECCPNFKHNNLPAKKIKPERKLKKELLCIGAASLSCFETLEDITTFFEDISATNPKFATLSGCCVAIFSVTGKDGERTKASDNGHFSFFEFNECDLNIKCKIIKELTEECGI